jgi:hypothetical protein
MIRRLSLIRKVQGSHFFLIIHLLSYCFLSARHPASFNKQPTTHSMPQPHLAHQTTPSHRLKSRLNQLVSCNPSLQLCLEPFSSQPTLSRRFKRRPLASFSLRCQVQILSAQPLHRNKPLGFRLSVQVTHYNQCRQVRTRSSHRVATLEQTPSR